MKDYMQELLDQAVAEGRKVLKHGAVADYIPELRKADPAQLGVSLTDLSGVTYSSGDTDVPFTIQSIEKVFSLLYALETVGPDAVFSRVGMEPSGASFMELTTLSDFSDKPSNPLINAGAIVVSSLIAAETSFDAFHAYVKRLCSTDSLPVNQAVCESEWENSERNHSLAWELKRLRLLSADLETSLKFYTRSCSIEVTARKLARFAVLLANGGKNPRTGEQVVGEDAVRITVTLLFTCGLYDGAGSFAVSTGLPAKSGVGGGIMAVAHRQLGIGTFGPALNGNGNSIGSLRALEYLTDRLNWHTFA